MKNILFQGRNKGAKTTNGKKLSGIVPTMINIGI
jgi:hypothetical protein